MAFFPEQAIERLTAAADAGRLAHAYLLSGEEGSGKRVVVKAIGARLLGIEDPERSQDAYFVRPESKSRRIVIDQMRELEGALHQTSLLGGAKLAVIEDADRLQPQAANAFLLTLEEPPEGTHLFLLTSREERMLETIRSRCVKVPLRSKGRKDFSAEDLQLAGAVEAAASAEEGLIAALRLARAVLNGFAAARERLELEMEAEEKLEEERYGKSVDQAWFDEREALRKARLESDLLAERVGVVNLLLAVFAEALRLRHGCAVRHGIGQAAGALSRWEPGRLLKAVETLDQLASNLDRPVNESLAVESAMVEIFAIKNG